MNLNALDFNLLKHLQIILNEKNISEAARKAGITQPAMSKSLKKIREILQDEILIKNGPSYQLTEKASSLVDKVGNVIKDLELVFTPCTNFDPQTEKITIKIVSSDYGNLIYLPKIIQKLEKYPNIKLEVYSPQEQDLNRLREEDVDFYMGIGKLSLLPESLIVKKIFSETLLSAVGKQHPLSKKEEISLEDFISFPHLLISNLNLNTGNLNLVYNKGVLDLELEKAGVQRNVAMVVPHFAIAPNLLQKSQLILSAPSRLITYFATQLELTTFNPPVTNNPESEFYIAWHPLNIQKRSNSWFKQEIIDKII